MRPSPCMYASASSMLIQDGWSQKMVIYERMSWKAWPPVPPGCERARANWLCVTMPDRLQLTKCSNSSAVATEIDCAILGHHGLVAVQDCSCVLVSLAFASTRDFPDYGCVCL